MEQTGGKHYGPVPQEEQEKRVMGLLKGLIHRHQEGVDAENDDGGPVWQALPDLDLSEVDSQDEGSWAKPSACPTCGARGYLDRIDVARKVTSQHCPWCWTKWEEPIEP